MTSLYCDALDGECFNFGNCDNCVYNGSALYNVEYETVLIISMQEPCGLIKQTSSHGNFFIMAKNEAIAEDKALALIEHYFVQDQVLSIKISKVDTSAPEPSANCENCENYINGVCIVDFSSNKEG